jgi:two-component system, cell cycle sensor histidine kinase and response regulator CckA
MNPGASNIFEAVGWPVLWVDHAGAIRRMNAVAQRLFGERASRQLGQLNAIWAPENTITPIQFLAKGSKDTASVVSVKLLTQQSQAVSFIAALGGVMDGQARLVLVQLFSTDGEWRATGSEAGPMQKQKLDFALQLTRTVALDFNNAITGIMGHTSYLLGAAAPDHPWRPALLEVEKAATRAAEIANQLAAFGAETKDTRPRSAANLNNLVRRVVEWFQKNRPGEVQWLLQLETRLLGAQYDEAKVQQALTKVLENAVEAAGKNGRITANTRNLDVAETFHDHTVQLKPGAYVCLEVTDNGSGIQPSDLPRVFEPFFTTKPGHRGIGMALVYGIVTNHRGGVAVSSQPGQGTSVRIYLPAIQQVFEENQVVADQSGQAFTILVVDDEELVLTMAQMVLSDSGYHVLTAPSGEKAIEMLARTTSQVDLLITDMVMPGMNGRELIERFRALSPKTRVLCSTGCSPSQLPGLGHSLLPKPFTSQELLRKVRSLLAS